HVARGIFQENGPASATIANITTKRCVSFPQAVDQSIQVLCDDHEPVPPSRLRIATGLATAACAWSAKVESQVIPNECRELAPSVHVDLEIEIVSIESNSCFDVADDISNG